MQDNNIMISYKIQDVKIIKTKIINNEYHIYGIRNNKKTGKNYRLKDYRTVKILIDVYNCLYIYTLKSKDMFVSIQVKQLQVILVLFKKRCRISNRIKKRIETTFKDIR